MTKTVDTVRRREEKIGKEFEEFTKNHEMEIIKDNGVYRHINFRQPKTIHYSYSLVTWPGYLAITGDIANGYLFRRIHDMFEFFSTDRDINPQYWGEKCIGSPSPIEEHSEEVFHLSVAEHLSEDWTGLEEAELEVIRADWKTHTNRYEIQYREQAYDALRDFESNGYRFSDVWEMEFVQYDLSFLLACYAIKQGVHTYLDSKKS